MRNGIIQFLLIFCAVSLLFFPQTSIDGAKNGLLLWSATITPTLLPFLLLSGFMQYYQTFHFLSRLFFPLKSSLKHCPTAVSFKAKRASGSFFPCNTRFISSTSRRISSSGRAIPLSSNACTQPLYRSSVAASFSICPTAIPILLQPFSISLQMPS